MTREERIKDFFEKFYSYSPKQRLGLCTKLVQDKLTKDLVADTIFVHNLRKNNLLHFAKEVDKSINLLTEVLELFSELAQEADKELEESKE